MFVARKLTFAKEFERVNFASVQKILKEIHFSVRDSEDREIMTVILETAKKEDICVHSRWL